MGVYNILVRALALQHLVDDCRREQPFVIRLERASGVERGASIDSSPIIGTQGDTQMSSPQQSTAVETTSTSTEQLAGAGSQAQSQTQALDSASQSQQTTSAVPERTPSTSERPATPPSTAFLAGTGTSPASSSSAGLEALGTASQATSGQQAGVEQMDTSSGVMGEPSTSMQLAAPLPGVVCPPRRTQLIKVVLEFLKKCITDHVFADSVRHSMCFLY